MIRHTVLVRWNEDTTEHEKAAFLEALNSLPDKIDVIRDYRVGHDAGLSDGNWDFVIVGDFDDHDDFVTYRDHPEHRAFIENYYLPHVADRAAAQYEH